MSGITVPKVGEVKTIACIGMGTMYRGWAALMLSAGFKVVAFDSFPTAREQAVSAVTKFISWLHSKGKLLPPTQNLDPNAIMGNLIVVDNLPALAVYQPTIAFEIVTEDRAVKEAVYVEMNRAFEPDVIFWSNTSGITTIPQLSGRPDRTVVTHGMNPPHLTKAVEVVGHDKLDPAVRDFTHQFLQQRLQKITFNAPNIPGFLVNHLGIPFWLQVVEMIERRGVEVIDLDTGITGSLGYPQGPCLLMDYIGLDVMALVADDIRQALQELGEPDYYLARYEVPDMLRGLVERKELGVKSGKGFYDWTDPKNPVPRKRTDLLH